MTGKFFFFLYILDVSSFSIYSFSLLFFMACVIRRKSGMAHNVQQGKNGSEEVEWDDDGRKKNENEFFMAFRFAEHIHIYMNECEGTSFKKKTFFFSFFVCLQMKTFQ